MNTFIKKNKSFLLLLTFVLFWFVLLQFISPSEIVQMLGINASYLVLFLTALLGVSGFTSSPFYSSLLVLLSSGDLNIFIILLLVVPALTLGDAIFLLLGHKGSDMLKGKSRDLMLKFSTWLQKQKKWKIFAVAYFYTAFTPLPQDILMISLGLAQISFKKVLLAVFCGNATFISILYILSINF